ncbi:hypothetical protein NDU88_001653 [Pleurodeles waltl]|uniref:Uncharacterized protein n=1 Tax=Pleurodeles waltl TaxID=8319 RepID=A0AAV7WJ30_PLEWA|nr:hypothetical protein NDU88_001653 [Pleurodeles waltl]
MPRVVPCLLPPRLREGQEEGQGLDSLLPGPSGKRLQLPGSGPMQRSPRPSTCHNGYSKGTTHRTDPRRDNCVSGRLSHTDLFLGKQPSGGEYQDQVAKERPFTSKPPER